MDKILDGFLRRQFEQGMALANECDRFDLVPLDPPPAPRRYIACFHCTGLVRTPSGEVTEANQFAAGIVFPDDYLRRADPFQVLTWLGPRAVFHPNISDCAPLICVGRIAPGMPLVELIYQLHQIITFNKATMREDDALNHDACAWTRRNLSRLPVDRRPLKRRRLELAVEPVGAGK